MADINRITDWAINIVAGAILIIQLVHYFLKGGLVIAGQKPGSQILAINNAVTPIADVIMSGVMLRFWFKRLRSPVISFKIGSAFFFVGAILAIVLYVSLGMTNVWFSVWDEVVARAGREAISYWIGICFMSLILRGYLATSLEGLVMVVCAITVLWLQSGIASLVLPQIGDFGFWLMRYPGLGANTAYWFAMYIGLATFLAKIFTGKAKISAGR